MNKYNIEIPESVKTNDDDDPFQRKEKPKIMIDRFE